MSKKKASQATESNNFFNQHTGKWTTFPMSWLTSTDHKRIGLMYGYSMFFFFGLAALIGLIIKLQKMYPASSGWEIIPPSLYGSFFTLHGVIMIFLFILPGASAVLGNFLLPLQLGAKDVAFPRVNLLSFWLYLGGAILAVVGILLGAADTGWTFTPPYSVTTKTISIFGFSFDSVSWMLVAAFILGWGTILTGINFIVTIHRMRCKGMTLFRMPLFSWTLYATSWIQVLATPVVGITLLMLAIERVMPVGFFDPAKGGDPILYQHLFWIYSHPAVYIMILPTMGLVSEILPTYCQRPIFGYKSIALSSCALAIFGYFIWAHHMFTTGMSDFANAVFSLLTFLVAIPTAIKVFNWSATLYKASISFQPALLFAIAYVFNFMIGGLTGMFLGSLSTSIHLHDTEFIVAHFHYTMFGGAAFGLIAGTLHYFPKMFGRIYSKGSAYAAFVLMFVGFHATYVPMFIMGMNGLPRRYHTYPDIPLFSNMQFASTIGSWILVSGIMLLLFTLVRGILKGEVTTERNPWNSSTLEWQTATPPTLFNFEQDMEVTRDPYDYPAFRLEQKKSKAGGKK
ncbi:MAG: cytochrome c oxidase subunit I [Bdellovibrionales bacterium]|jgi:cytochrome c oxidase subunit I|nr:cytochrome c oxidase subunit I [Bdellovibrionales bacterium]MBT3527004.1 cytochrome c oxidase subunit I [Bdellovibrionales bacterium]MBT7669509.1 cytochrome c oxidase subunit I [Bdellovibrionales bacterium]MBT7766331.1 cytochrome c oxidase subunit I [Bdellovibrionales bacterium]